MAEFHRLRSRDERHSQAISPNVLASSGLKRKIYAVDSNIYENGHVDLYCFLVVSLFAIMQ